MQDLLTVPLSPKRKRYLQQLDGGIDEEPEAKKARTGSTPAHGQANGQAKSTARTNNPVKGQQVSLETCWLTPASWWCLQLELSTE